MKDWDWRIVAAVIGIPAAMFAAVVQGKAAWEATEPAHFASHEFVRSAVKLGMEDVRHDLAGMSDTFLTAAETTAKQNSQDLGKIWVVVLQSRIDVLRGQLVQLRTQEIDMKRQSDLDAANRGAAIQLVNIQTEISSTERMLSQAWCDFSKQMGLASAC